MASIITDLISFAEREWEFFERSTIALDGRTFVGRKEHEDGIAERVADYWQFIGGPFKNLTGRDRGTPWSAAFISFCFHEAGAGDQFPYSAAHAKFINTAIRNASDPTAALVGHKLKGYRLKPGDLIGYWRGDTKITFDNARGIGSYMSHTDIVVAVDKGVAHSIGGNVMHSVTRRAVRLGSEGDLTDRSQNWFVAIANNL